MRYVVQGLTEGSFKNMWIDAGALFENLEITGGETAEEVAEILEAAREDGKALGATTGGASFSATPETRDIEADGKRFAFVGSTVVDAYDVAISTTLKEITKGNLQRAIPTSEFDEATNSIGLRMAIDEDNYIKSLWLIGNINDDSFIGIKIDNALNVSGAALQTTDKEEGTIECEFRGHSDGLKSQYAPGRIYFFPTAEQAAAGNGGNG